MFVAVVDGDGGCDYCRHCCHHHDGRDHGHRHQCFHGPANQSTVEQTIKKEIMNNQQQQPLTFTTIIPS